MPYDASLIALLSPLTPLHVGVGRSGGIVDLPVQRDSLGFPIIYASSLKGAVKSEAYLRNDLLAKKLFGPEPGDEERYASPVSLTDAYLLLMPARSLKNNPVLVTSPFLVSRALDIIDLVLAAGSGSEDSVKKLKKLLEDLLKAGTAVNEGTATPLSDEPVVEEGGRCVFIGGERLKANDTPKDLADKARWKTLKAALPNAFGNTLPERVVLLTDDCALRVIERSLIRLTRVRLDRSRKTVAKGCLWTEEYLPQGALLISAILLSTYRAKAARLENGNSGDLKRVLRSKLFEALGMNGGRSTYLVFGGKESIGKGITKVLFV